MPYAKIADGRIHYEVIGTGSQSIALNPGGRSSLERMQPIAEQLANQGYRVLIHDRRNTGSSDLMLSGDDPELAIWGDHLHELLEREDALPAIIGGGSAGCIMSLLMALRHPASVSGLLLWQVTDGSASEHVADEFYNQYVEIAKTGGMEAVAETSHFAERITQNPVAREQLLATKVEDFTRVFTNWGKYCQIWQEQHILGCTEEDLQTIQVPACVIPGGDDVHTRRAGETLAKLLPKAELHQAYTEDERQMLIRLSKEARQRDRQERQSKIYADFLRRWFSQ